MTVKLTALSHRDKNGRVMRIVWKGSRIAKVIFPSGRVVEFQS